MDNNLITYLACICFIFLFGKLFIVPLKKILKLILNSILGGISIYIINLVGANFGFHIGLNFFTSVIIGLLGLPGAICLIIVKLLIGWYCLIIYYKLMQKTLDVLKISKGFLIYYSTVTDFAKFLGLSTSNPFSFEM